MEYCTCLTSPQQTIHNKVSGIVLNKSKKQSQEAHYLQCHVHSIFIYGVLYFQKWQHL